MLNRQNSPGAVEGLAAAAGTLATRSSLNLCNSLPPPTPASSLSPVTEGVHMSEGQEYEAAGATGASGSVVWGGAIKSWRSLTEAVTDHNHRELWSLISATAGLRQNGDPQVKPG